MLLVDTCNLYHCIRQKYGSKYRLNYAEYVKVVERLFGPQEKLAYVSYPNPSVDAFIVSLKKLGFKIQTKAPHDLESATDFKITDFCVEMTLQSIQVIRADSPIIIGSSDRRLEPLLNVLKRKAGAVGVVSVGIPYEFGKYGSTCELKVGSLNEIV